MLRGLLLALALVVGARAVEAGPQAAPPDDPTWLESARIPGVSFEELQSRANEAMGAGQAEEALRYFRAGVALNPEWTQGWFYVGSLSYAQGRHAAAREAFTRVLGAAPALGPAWALLGFSEFQLGEYDRSFAALSRALTLGFEGGEDIESGVHHHLALLRIRRGDFEGAVQHLLWLARSQPPSPPILEASGLMILRRPILPSQIPDDEKELVTTAGWAAYSALAGRYEEARPLFEDLVRRFPEARGVHLAFGLFLAGRGSEEALAMVSREAELFPDNARAQIEVAFQHLERGNAADALPSAEVAVRLAPDVYTSHLALGRALVASGELARGTAELEKAEELGPEVGDVYVALAQAYAQASRTSDVERVRQRLRELDAEKQPHTEQ